MGSLFTSAALAAIVLGVAVRWQMPSFLALLALPALFATTLAGPGYGFIAATSSTLAVVVLLVTRLLPTTPEPGIVLALLWSAYGILYMAQRQMREVAGWSWAHWQHAHEWLDEAQQRKLELEQALDDLTHANRQMGLANERMAALRQMADDARRGKETFVAHVSHEFRAPLNIIIGMVSLMVENPELYEGEFPPTAIGHLQAVYRNARHLAGMVDDVLNLSQVEAGHFTLRRDFHDLREIIESSIEVVRPLLEKKGLRWRLEIPAGLPPIYCDRVRIRQVILNLLSNAVRFTEQGMVAVYVTAGEGSMRLCVSDTGSGIAPEDAERIFEPFVQGMGRPDAANSGSGLGLAISKQFVELHGGRIWLESQPGEGSTFFLDLPWSPAPGPSAGPARWINEEWIWHERGSRARLPDSQYRPRLVLCDESGNLEQALAQAPDDVEVVSATGLEEALAEVRRCPAVALLLGSMSTTALLPLVEEARRQCVDTPIVGCCCPPRPDPTARNGVLAYVTKPISQEAFEAAIQRAPAPLRRVLVVDDDADARELIRLALHRLDPAIDIAVAASGAEALGALRAAPPDLVLLDVMMPDMDGWQVLQTMREDPATAATPVVMVSAQDVSETPARAQALVLTMGEGLPLGKLAGAVAAFSALMLGREGAST